MKEKNQICFLFSFGMKYGVELNEEDVSNFRWSIFMSLLTPYFFFLGTPNTHETARADSKLSPPMAIRRAFSKSYNKLWKKNMEMRFELNFESVLKSGFNSIQKLLCLDNFEWIWFCNVNSFGSNLIVIFQSLEFWG